MALAFTSITFNVVGSKRVTTAVTTFDSSYPTGGEDIDLDLLSLNQLDTIKVAEPGGAAGAAFFSTGGSVALGGTSTAPKLLLFSSGVEAANGSNQASCARIIEFYGK